jgi:hypothetical protein
MSLFAQLSTDGGGLRCRLLIMLQWTGGLRRKVYADRQGPTRTNGARVAFLMGHPLALGGRRRVGDAAPLSCLTPMKLCTGEAAPGHPSSWAILLRLADAAVRDVVPLSSPTPMKLCAEKPRQAMPRSHATRHTNMRHRRIRRGKRI